MLLSLQGLYRGLGVIHYACTVLLILRCRSCSSRPTLQIEVHDLYNCLQQVLLYVTSILAYFQDSVQDKACPMISIPKFAMVSCAGRFCETKLGGCARLQMYKSFWKVHCVHKLFASHWWWADSLYEKCKLKHLIVFILTSALPHVGPQSSSSEPCQCMAPW